jgi:hypothetical protein
LTLFGDFYGVRIALSLLAVVNSKPTAVPHKTFAESLTSNAYIQSCKVALLFRTVTGWCAFPPIGGIGEWGAPSLEIPYIFQLDTWAITYLIVDKPTHPSILCA